MGKCRFCKICKGYSKDSQTCNKSDGFYIDEDIGCKFYRKYEKLEEKIRKRKSDKK